MKYLYSENVPNGVVHGKGMAHSDASISGLMHEWWYHPYQIVCSENKRTYLK